MSENSQIPEEAIEVLKGVSSGMVVDALAVCGIKGAIPGVRPVRGFEDAKVIGPAATIMFGRYRPSNRKLNNYVAIRNSMPGSVLVIDGKGLDAHFSGDNQGHVAKKHGLLATVVYGGARDIAGYREIGMPLYCTGPATVDKPDDLQVVSHNVSIEVGGVVVKPGDVVFADEDGVVVTPVEALDMMIENLRTIISVESEMEKAIQRDASIDELSAIIAKKKPKK